MTVWHPIRTGAWKRLPLARMPQIMAEAFARGLLDKIMIQVLDVIDRNAEDGKSWEQHVNEETGDAIGDASEYVHGRPQTNERTHINYSKTEEIELIAKIVRDLRDIRIGDSRYVLPPSLLALEKQVKCTANNDDAPLTNPSTDVAETQHTTRGQGDTHQIVHTAILESPAEQTESVKMIRQKKEGEAANEATNVSVGLLQQLMEGLENKAASACFEDDASSDSISKELIAEKKEEQFIRIIENNTGEMHEVATRETPRDSESIGRFRVIELKHDELRSHSSQHVASTSREIGLEEVRIEKRGSNSLSSLKPSRDDGITSVDQILPVNDAEKRKTFNETATKKKKKKRGFGSRLRNLLRAAFGRRKN